MIAHLSGSSATLDWIQLRENLVQAENDCIFLVNSIGIYFHDFVFVPPWWVAVSRLCGKTGHHDREKSTKKTLADKHFKSIILIIVIIFSIMTIMIIIIIMTIATIMIMMIIIIVMIHSWFMNHNRGHFFKIISQILPGIPCRLFTPQLSWILSFSLRNGWTKLEVVFSSFICFLLVISIYYLNIFIDRWLMMICDWPVMNCEFQLTASWILG